MRAAVHIRRNSAVFGNTYHHISICEFSGGKSPISQHGQPSESPDVRRYEFLNHGEFLWLTKNSSTNLVIILGMMQVSKRVPFDDPQVLMGVRILYVLSNLIIFGLYYYIGMNIKAKRGLSAGAPLF